MVLGQFRISLQIGRASFCFAGQWIVSISEAKASVNYSMEENVREKEKGAWESENSMQPIIKGMTDSLKTIMFENGERAVIDTGNRAMGRI